MEERVEKIEEKIEGFGAKIQNLVDRINERVTKTHLWGGVGLLAVLAGLGWNDLRGVVSDHKSDNETFISRENAALKSAVDTKNEQLLREVKLENQELMNEIKLIVATLDPETQRGRSFMEFFLQKVDASVEAKTNEILAAMEQPSSLQDKQMFVTAQNAWSCFENPKQGGEYLVPEWVKVKEMMLPMEKPLYIEQDGSFIPLVPEGR